MYVCMYACIWACWWHYIPFINEYAYMVTWWWLNFDSNNFDWLADIWLFFENSRQEHWQDAKRSLFDITFPKEYAYMATWLNFDWLVDIRVTFWEFSPGTLARRQTLIVWFSQQQPVPQYGFTWVLVPRYLRFSTTLLETRLVRFSRQQLVILYHVWHYIHTHTRVRAHTHTHTRVRAQQH